MKHLIPALLIPIVALAAETGQLVDVVATGHGSTVREATKASLRAAVEQVVGTMVDATTLVENDELIEDEILRYSAGMVESAKQIGEPKKSEDGFYTVKVKATVRKGKLEEKLRTASAVSVALDGADLFARMTAAQDNLADAEAMIKDVLAKHISCVVAEAVPGENGKSPLDLDPKTGEVLANVRVRVDMAKYAQFAKEVLDKLGPMATKKQKIVSKGWHKTDWKYAGDGWIDFDIPGLNRSSDKEERNFLLVMENLRSGSATVLWFDDNEMNAVRDGLDAGIITVKAVLLDKSGMTAAERFVPVSSGNPGWNGPVPSILCGGERYLSGAIVPFFGGEGLNFYGGVSHENKSSDNCQPKTDQTFRIPLGTFTADELKAAGKLEINVGHMKDGQFVE